MKPVFIFCTPRSGSTLLQRLLASHPKIASVSEPWLLLPLINATSSERVLASYSHQTSVKAINNFVNKIPEGVYQEKLREFVLGLYQAIATDGMTYFLDKTPRYYYIINEIADLFPDAKFIFLTRDPKDTLASVITTWCNGGFSRLYKHHDDLYLAPKLLSQAYNKHTARSLLIKYEDLVSDYQAICSRVFEYLALEPFDVSFEKNDIGQTEKEMGDSVGQQKYSMPSTNSIGSWQSTFNNPVRHWFLKRYITSVADSGESNSLYLDENYRRLYDQKKVNWHLRAIRDIFEIFCQYALNKSKLYILFRLYRDEKRSGFYE